jgi:hypothetical protein
MLLDRSKRYTISRSVDGQTYSCSCVDRVDLSSHRPPLSELIVPLSPSLLVPFPFPTISARLALHQIYQHGQDMQTSARRTWRLARTSPIGFLPGRDRTDLQDRQVARGCRCQGEEEAGEEETRGGGRRGGQEEQEAVVVWKGTSFLSGGRWDVCGPQTVKAHVNASSYG